MKELILQTSNDWLGLILRLTAGCIMLPHGLQKAFGFFGGFGFKATMAYFTDSMQLPWLIAFLVILIEVIAPLGLIVGVLSRVWALSIVVVMVGAIATTNARHGLFMNWFGTQDGEGYEYHLLMIGICLSVVIAGSGKLSIDRLLQ